MSTDENSGKDPAPPPAPTVAPARLPRRGRTMAIAVVAIALTGAAGFALQWWRAQGRYRIAVARTHAGPAAVTTAAGTPELAFLAPLMVGSTVEGATVSHVSAVEDGLVHVDLRKDGQTHHFAIGLVHPGYTAPRAGQYAVYIWEQVPKPGSSALAEALARTLRPHAARPPPPGLTAGTFDSPPH